MKTIFGLLNKPRGISWEVWRNGASQARSPR